MGTVTGAVAPGQGALSLGAEESEQVVPLSRFWSHRWAFAERQDHRKNMKSDQGVSGPRAGPSRAWEKFREGHRLWGMGGEA